MKTLLLTPTGPGVGLTSVCLGLVHALDQMGLRVKYFKPISFAREGVDRSTALVAQSFLFDPPEPVDLQRANSLISEGKLDLLLEDIISLRQSILEQNPDEQPDVLVVEGINESSNETLFDQFNLHLARALDAQVILISTPQASTVEELNSHLLATASQFGGVNDSRVLGCIINMLNAPLDRQGHIRPDITSPTFNTAFGHDTLVTQLPVLQRDDFHLVGAIPWHRNLTAPRTVDVMAFLLAQPLSAGEAIERRVWQVVVATQQVDHLIPLLKPGTLVITSPDRSDILITAAMAQQNGVALAGLLLTHPSCDRPAVREFCRPAIDLGLPIYQTELDTYQTVNLLPGFDNRVPVEDTTRIQYLMETVAQNLDKHWLRRVIDSDRAPRVSPAAFRYSLVQKARRAKQRIVLPEGDEPRTIQAAITCHHRGIAHCILMGNPESVRTVAAANGLVLPERLEILDPEPLRPNYVSRLMDLRRHKGLTEERAIQELEDNVVLGTLMLFANEVDGLVSGAVHTTANTIRPALQLIRTKPGVNIVSSVFFMCLPDQVMIFGDCAINPDPDASQLADIAIESADTAVAFGIPPKVAMISYSTLESGSGVDVDKVREATRIVREKRPDILVDGPLQYDAAVIKGVASKKAPTSAVAGEATVLIFPDLNTGNTTYKAVQRSANVISIGPMLQGLNKPVNDLSRGAKVDDIIYTIALTAIQAQE
ncbi:phosphate acetyltransferase [Ketobacter sp.]|uniref:phosphate acetyltransferase n=1 Tax=Ketobacter sp. TaxID=2083498 RepID=UPI000F101119|nr:phosphate acetyltransferase [Ketobacter sp.]RLU00303.1 MAG: phosphate acetyltransferase [Ketobacter sp.]